MADEDKRPLSRSEKVKNYLIGIGAISGLILALFANFRGEPEAKRANDQVDKTWRTLRKQVNRQSEAINKLHLRMVHFQGTMEGMTAGKLQEKLERLQRRYDELMSAKGPKLVKQLQKKPTKVTAKAPPKPKKECPPGWVEAEGKCRRVHRSVAKRVSKDKQKMLEAKRKLEQERRRRKELERRKRELERKMVQQKQGKVPKLRLLPDKLDDAAK